MKRLICFLVTMVLLSGCGTMSYIPTVDPKGLLITMDVVTQDFKECSELAGMEWNEVLSAGLIGGGGGAAMGATAGTMIGGLAVASMATGGAVAMGIPALGYGIFKGTSDAKMAFRMCLRGRGYSVIK